MRLRAHMYARGWLETKTLACPVVSIGNLIAGGTGKTPMTILVARLLKKLGYRIVVISRGYRGRLEKTGGIVSDGHTIFKGPADAGDEPYLLATILKGVPVVVGRHRYDAGMMAIEHFKPDLLVLDDAFQHQRLHRDLNLVLLDRRSPIGNGHLLPRGALREPVSALRRADAVIFTRSDRDDTPASFDGLPVNITVFHTCHVPLIRRVLRPDGTLVQDVTDLSTLKGKTTVAFAGLADNAQFFNILVDAGCILLDRFSFGDHHGYGRRDCSRIARSARACQAEVLITTHKDFVKIEANLSWPVELMAVDVEIQLIDNEQQFLSILTNVLN